MKVVAGIFTEVPPHENHDGFSWYFLGKFPQENMMVLAGIF